MNFSRVIKRALLLAATVSLLSCEKEVPYHDIDVEIQMAMEKYDLPSVSACVIKNNAIVWKQSYE